MTTARVSRDLDRIATRLHCAPENLPAEAIEAESKLHRGTRRRELRLAAAAQRERLRRIHEKYQPPDPSEFEALRVAISDAGGRWPQGWRPLSPDAHAALMAFIRRQKHIAVAAMCWRREGTRPLGGVRPPYRRPIAAAQARRSRPRAARRRGASTRAGPDDCPPAPSSELTRATAGRCA